MNKTTMQALNVMLKRYDAKVSTEGAILQSKEEGYIGDQFKDSNKPVYCFDVVCIKTGLSYANVNSPVYQKIPYDIKTIFFNSYFETSKRIYV